MIECSMRKMSRKSENSAQGSIGDGDSLFSSQENSPRKSALITGPSGDFSDDQQTGLIIYKVENENFPSDDDDDDEDDFESTDLKIEYLHHLALIREKLASIDIANKSYYNNCFSSDPPNQCIITEILDDDNDENNKNQPDEENNNLEKCISTEILGEKINIEPASSAEIIINQPEIVIPSLFIREQSANELFDLNYNPPKKKTCIRDNTPRLVLSEGALPLPYHIRVGLHREIAKVDKLIKPDHLERNNNINHHPPKVRVKASRKITTEPLKKEIIHEDTEANNKVDDLFVLFLDSKLDKSYCSESSPKSNETFITETTITIDSARHKPKKRRVFLRSARNKVKPIDNITLWEEIRTMEAMNRRKRLESNSSNENLFKNILLKSSKENNEPLSEITVMNNVVGSLDMPRKSSSVIESINNNNNNNKSVGRFPSITKITKFCSSIFSKKNNNNVMQQMEIIKNDQESEIKVEKVANTLLNLEQDQEDFDLENDEYTPSNEVHSEYVYHDGSEDDIDEYYQPYCLFCYCF